MQINIRYGDITKPLNMNCKCGVILEHIRKCADIDPNVLLDLTDKDGNVKLLRQNPTAYATTILSANQTYYLVSAIEEQQQFIYTLLVTLAPGEPQIDVKPTKADKPPPPKRPAPKIPPKGGKKK